MTPTLFEGSTGADEYQLCNDLGVDAMALRLKRHRDTFITWDDLRWIKQHGLNAIRLPIPHWLFGGFEPFVPCVQYVDWLVDAAEKQGLLVLLDMHTAPGSQNGWDHSGQSGAIAWDRPQHRNYFLAVMQAVVARYAHRSHIIGIELMNEPHPSIDMRILSKFYIRTCKALRAEQAAVPVYVSDSYRPQEMRDQACITQYNIGIDMHLYQAFDAADKQLDLQGHMQKAQIQWPDLIDHMQLKTPVIVGEWSLALAADTYNGMDQAAIDTALRQYGAAQLSAFRAAQGWFYWSYKTENSPEWSYRAAIEHGWLPQLSKE